MKLTVAELLSAGVGLEAPVQLDVQLDPAPDNASPETSAPSSGAREMTLELESVDRILPGRRVSGRARMLASGSEPESEIEPALQKVFAKVFVGAQAHRYWSRELTGARLMQDAGVASPSVCGQGTTRDGAGWIILYTHLDLAEPVAADHAVGIEGAVRCLAQMHNADLVQTDAHLGNFLTDQTQVWAVDADGIRRERNMRGQLRNFATLLAQRPPHLDAAIADLWQVYTAVRDVDAVRATPAANVVELVRQARHDRVRRYLKKTQRECTEFVHRRTFRRDFVCAREAWPALQRFMVAPEELVGDGTPLKLGNSSTVVRCELAGQRYVVKRYNLKSFTHRMRRWFKRRGRNAWCNGHWLAFLHIPTARPVALLEERVGWFAGRAYLVMPDHGGIDLLHALQEDAGAFDRLAPAVAQIISQLQHAGLRHGDLKATNFVLNGASVALIDYDALDYGDTRADVQRFLANWANEPALQARWVAVLQAAGVAC